VRVDSLEETEGDPDVDGKDVQVTQHVAVQERAADRAETEDEDLRWVRVLRREAERCTVLVVDLVDVLVHGSPVQSLMR
jgi:hypothetical protein